MTRVASPPRRPSILAIRSRWPVHVPTRDTESSALNTGVETRMANAAEYKRAFMWGLHAWVLRSCTADVRKVLPTYLLAERARLRKNSASLRWWSPRARPALHRRRRPIAKIRPSELGGLDFPGGGSRYGCLVSSVQDTMRVVSDRCM